MAVALGEGGIKTLEDLAGAATDDLLGYYETSKDKERVRIPGALEGFNLTTDDANAIIMKARVKIGWIEEDAGGRSRLKKRRRGSRRGLMTAAARKMDEDETMREDVSLAALARANAAASSRAKSCPTIV